MVLVVTAFGLAPALGAGPSARAEPPPPAAPLIEAEPLPPAGPAVEANRWPGATSMIDRLASEAERDASAGDWVLARLYRLWNINHLLGRPQRVQRALSVLSRRGSPLVRAHAQYMQATLHRRAGALREAAQNIDDLGLITDGWVVGPFGNSTGGGHDTAYPPEAEIDPTDSFESDGRPLRWRRLRGLAPHGAIELSSLLATAEEATAYVAVIAQSDRRRAVALRTGSGDALKVWVNGRLVMDRSPLRFASLDQDAVGIVLQRGPNLLLFKSSWRDGRGRLFARLTRPNGSRLTGVRMTADERLLGQVRPMTRPGKVTRPIRVRSVRDALTRRPRRVPPVEWLALKADMIAVMGLYDQRRLPSPAEELLREAVRSAPDDPHLRFFLAHRVKARDPKLAREQLRAALTADPGYAPAWLALGEMAREGQRLLEAREHLDTAIERDVTFLPASVTRSVLGFDELSEHIVAIRRLANTPGALESSPARVQLGRMRRALDDARGARLDLEAALQRDATDRLTRNILIDLAVDASDQAEALRLIAEQVKLEPWSLAARLQQVRLTRPFDRDQARRLLAQTESLFPEHPEVPALRGELALGEGKTAAAIAAFDRALTLDPHQPNLRKHRRYLAGETSDLASIHGADAATLARSPETDAEKALGAIYLTDRTAVELTASGRSIRYRQQVIRVSKARLKNALRVHRVHYSPSREDVEILTAERIRPDGQILKAAAIRDDGPRGKVAGMYIDQRYKVILFQEVEPGDTLHIAYRMESRGENMFGGFFGDVQAVQGVLPKRDVRYSVTAPASRPLYSATIRLPDPKRETLGDTHRLGWHLPEVEALDFEPLSPPYPQIGQLLSVSTYDRWDSLGAWYSRLYADQLQLDEDARQAGRQVVDGIDDPAEKVRRLYEYVVKNTRYVGIELGIHGWKPFKAAEVHRRRYGDCKDKSTLLSALLRDNGVDATITLVRTSDRGHMPEDHATMWAFNHAITYVPQLDWYLDPTAEFNGSRELPHQDQGAMALVVHPDGQTQLTTLPLSSPRDNLNASDYQARIDRDGRLVMEGQEWFYGARAAELRRELEEQDDRTRLIERQLAQVFPGVRIQAFEVSDLTSLEKPVRYDYRFEVPKYGQLKGDRLLVPVALYQHEVSQAYAKLADRQHAIRLPHAWETNNKIRYRLPEGARITRLPEGIDVDTPYIALRQTVRRVEGGFETDDTVTLKRREIPADAYAEFREACLAIDRAMQRKVEIQW